MSSDHQHYYSFVQVIITVLFSEITAGLFFLYEGGGFLHGC